MTTNTKIIYKVTCIPTSKVYIATSTYTDPVEAFKKTYEYTMRDKDILVESDLSDIVLDIIKYDISRFKVELLDQGVPMNELAFLKMKYIRELAKELGEDYLYNNISNGNRKNSSKVINHTKPTRTYYALVSQHFLAITIFEDRYCDILRSFRNKRSKYYEANQNSINNDMFDSYDKALSFVRKQLKILTGDSYDENTIKKLCMRYRVVSVRMLSDKAMILGYCYPISSQQYSDMIQEQRRIQTDIAMQEIVKLLNYN